MRRMYSLEQLKNIADQRVKALIEGGTLANAKPIYFHGMELYNADTGEVLQMHVLNNSPTQFNLTTLRQWFTDIEGEVRAQCNGAHKISDSSWGIPYVIYKTGSDVLQLFYTTPTGKGNLVLNLSSLFQGIVDSVNKIN